MGNTGFRTFDETIQQTNETLKEIERAFAWQDRRNQSYGALRAVLHTLRDRLTIEEASELAENLPMLIRGIFYEGWQPSKVPKKLDKEEFLQEVRTKFRFSLEGDIQMVIEVVLLALKKYIGQGEAEDIVGILPKDLAKMVQPTLIG